MVETTNNPKINIMSKQTIDSARNLDRLFNEGVLFTLTIGKPSWTGVLTPEMLGISKFPKNFKKGRILLLPEARLQRIQQIEGAARRYLDSQSFAFDLSNSRAPFRFVHQDKMGRTLVELGEFKKQFFAERDKLKAQYEDAKEEMRKQAELDWEQLKTELNNQEIPSLWNVIESQLPTFNAKVDADYYFDYSTMRMAFPKQFENVDERKLLKEAEADADYKAKLEQELNAQRVKAERATREFIEETVRGIRGKVVDVFEKILEKRKKGEPLNKVNIDSMFSVLDYVKEMDFLNDDEFHKQLDTVRKTLNSANYFKNNNQALASLEAALKNTIEFANATTDTTAVATSSAYFSRNLDI